MFYCDKCATKNKWPTSFMRSYGMCECCFKARECNDVPSAMLPMVQGVKKLAIPVSKSKRRVRK